MGILSRPISNGLYDPSPLFKPSTRPITRHCVGRKERPGARVDCQQNDKNVGMRTVSMTDELIEAFDRTLDMMESVISVHPTRTPDNDSALDGHSLDHSTSNHIPDIVLAQINDYHNLAPTGDSSATVDHFNRSMARLDQSQSTEYPFANNLTLTNKSQTTHDHFDLHLTPTNESRMTDEHFDLNLTPTDESSQTPADPFARNLDPRKKYELFNPLNYTELDQEPYHLHRRRYSYSDIEYRKCEPFNNNHSRGGGRRARGSREGSRNEQTTINGGGGSSKNNVRNIAKNNNSSNSSSNYISSRINNNKCNNHISNRDRNDNNYTNTNSPSYYNRTHQTNDTVCQSLYGQQRYVWNQQYNYTYSVDYYGPRYIRHKNNNRSRGKGVRNNRSCNYNQSNTSTTTTNNSNKTVNTNSLTDLNPNPHHNSSHKRSQGSNRYPLNPFAYHRYPILPYFEIDQSHLQRYGLDIVLYENQMEPQHHHTQNNEYDDNNCYSYDNQTPGQGPLSNLAFYDRSLDPDKDYILFTPPSYRPAHYNKTHNTYRHH